MWAWTSTIWTLVWGACKLAGENAVVGFTKDEVEGLAEDEVEGLAKDAEEVTLSKTENLFQKVTERATFSQEWDLLIDDWERREGVTALLPVVEVEPEWREEAYVFVQLSFCLKRSSCLALSRLMNWELAN